MKWKDRKYCFILTKPYNHYVKTSLTQKTFAKLLIDGRVAKRRNISLREFTYFINRFQFGFAFARNYRLFCYGLAIRWLVGVLSTGKCIFI